MKTREDKRTAIFEKMNEISSLEDMRRELDERLFNEEGHYNFEVLDQFLEMNKKINYAKGAVIRMIKRLMDDIYENWTWSEKVDYLEAVKEFRRFAN
jgi:hypothetical protein